MPGLGLGDTWFGQPDPPSPTEASSAMNRANGKVNTTMSWVKKLSLSGKSISRSNTSTSLQSQAESLAASLNKPLPALPQPPYFEYMFSDAGVKVEKSEAAAESSSDNDEPQASHTEPPAAQATQVDPPTAVVDGTPAGLAFDTSAVTHFSFTHGGISVTPKEVIDDHLAALGTNLEGVLYADAAEDLENEKITEGFFAGGYEVREAPGPYHAPVVDEDGFADRREGLEEFPELWQHEKKISLRADKTSEQTQRPAPVQFTGPPVFYDGDLLSVEPAAYKPAPNATLLPDYYQGGIIEAVVPASQPASPASPVPHPRPLTIRKKRRAQESLSESTVPGPSSNDYSIQIGNTKRVRVAERLVEGEADTPRHVSVCGSIESVSVSSTCSDADLSAVSTPFTSSDEESEAALALKRKRLTNTLTGYPGQFESYEADCLHVRADRLSEPPPPFTIGDALHPNNEFVHINFVDDPTYPATNYTKADLEALPMRRLALEHAEMHATYADSRPVALLRTPSEECLRREVHRECAAARLEGVGVGQYRYYQGHRSLEDYNAARMCVCWDFCWCSKLCTIYGDVMCPCAEWIVLHKD